MKAESSSALTSSKEVDGEVVSSSEVAETNKEEVARTAVGQGDKVRVFNQMI